MTCPFCGSPKWRPACDDLCAAARRLAAAPADPMARYRAALIADVEAYHAGRVAA